MVEVIMKRWNLFIVFAVFLAFSAHAQVEIEEQLEQDVERLAEKFETLAERMAAKAEALAEKLEDKGARWQVSLGRPQQRARIGVQLENLPLEKARRLGYSNVYGSVVVKVFPGSPAQEAGLEPFDYLIGINGLYVDEHNSFSDLMKALEPGETVDVHLIRNGKELRVEITLDQGARIGYALGKQQVGWLGVSPAMQERAEDYDGVSIRVSRNSPAAKMGLQDGDVIKKINEIPILDWADLRMALNSLEAGEEVTIAFERAGRIQTTQGKLGSRFGNIRMEVPEIVIRSEDFDFDIPEDVEIEEIEINDFGEDWQESGRAYMGVYVEKISKEKAASLGIDNPYGLYVTGIVPGSAAEKAGLRPFDYIYGVDEFRVGQEQSLGTILKRYEPGDQAVLHIYRQGQKEKVNITFGKYAEQREESKPANDCEDPFFGIIQKPDSDGGEGIPVSVVEGSSAEAAGLQDGDVLIAINGNKMVDWDDVKIAINTLKPGELIEVVYLRNGEKRTGNAPIKSLAETRNCKNCDCEEDEEVVLKLDKAPKFKLKNKDDWKKPNGEANIRHSPKSITVKVEDATSELASLQQKGLVSTELGTGLHLPGFQLKADTDSGKFNFGFDLPSSGDLEIKVVNQANQIIYEAELIDYSGRFDDSLFLPQKLPAVYTIVVVQNGQANIKMVSFN